ncbi:MAG: SAM hydrolase/SAM-dependent halogenase family protein [Candidatus Binatia bacterium]
MVITLTTDFGYQDPFVGIMKGVIAAINPIVQVIDLTHGVPAQNVMAGALILQHSVRYFAAGTIHVVVVDPGVGSARKPILIEHEGSYFVGPDNGVLSLALERKPLGCIVELTNADYQLQHISETFHGRDVFAPVAAHLSLGVPPIEFGKPLDTSVNLVIPQIVRGDDRLDGEIIYTDSFGNLFTNIRERDLTGIPRERFQVSLAGVPLGGVVTTYAGASAREFACLFNSWGLLEIAVNKDSARQRTSAKIGDRVTVTVKD